MRVWFNRHFSVVVRICRLLRESRGELPITSIVSHRHSHFAGFTTADESFVEPAGLSPEDYVEWCLAAAVEHRIDWLVPGHDAAALARAEPAFNAIGVKLVNAAAAERLPNLHQKDWVYAHAPTSVPKPRYVVVDDDTNLESALASIESGGPACIKPCVSIYGHGYHRLASDQGVEGEAKQNNSDTLQLSEWRERYSAPSPERRQLVMEYLPGAEYSVDLACYQGEVIAGVARRKSPSGPVQTIEDRADLLAYATQLVEAFELHGLINVQFKDAADGTPKLLEINPRASGGIAMSCLSGLNLPWIAYSACLLDGRRVPISVPRYGIRVAEIPTAIVLPDRAA